MKIYKQDLSETKWSTEMLHRTSLLENLADMEAVRERLLKDQK